ncbi:MAG: GNAT family acetyltransferase [Tardiphaga sp.]|uniref:GNAT family acetyltransferase n=1 Tax=Tardiphaga sp. TaxID=1926292 RepID=UPI0019C666B2|nr:GNAT family acetyltransferase [Tardiphaga sp.]MBC7586355.1 GNAT family acetyltransferase [Tardiphaga sp.]
MRDDTGLAIAEITDADIADVISLWQRSGSTRPWNDPTRDIAFARESDNSTILIGRDGSAVMASVMVGHDGHRGWVYYVATDPDHRHKGYGRATMQAAEDWLRQRGVEKLQLMVRADNTQVQAYYESLGFGEQKRVIYAKWLDGRPLTP